MRFRFNTRDLLWLTALVAMGVEPWNQNALQMTSINGG
jgi:hypothetical protein